MFAHGMDASAAAYHVGYASRSQFSREYSRLFGAPPRRDVEQIRSRLGQQNCKGGYTACSNHESGDDSMTLDERQWRRRLKHGRRSSRL